MKRKSTPATGSRSRPAETIELERFLPYRLATLADAVSKDLSAVYRDRFGIKRAEWRVLAHLAAERGGSVREIHERANLDKPNVSRAVERLVALGHVQKSVNPRDRRLVQLELTRSGRALYSKIVPLALDFERTLLASLTRVERETLERALSKLLDARK